MISEHVTTTIIAHVTILIGQVAGFAFQYLLAKRQHRWSMEKLGTIERKVENGHARDA